jgi:hypothetical protein
VRILFDVYKNGEKKNYNPSWARMSWVETTQVVRVPRVPCFDPFFLEQPVNSWLDHIRHYEQSVPLRIELALFVGMTNKHHVTWIDVLSQNFLVSLGLRFFMIFAEV